jgi:2-dehydro-3-deoxygluconokinase
MTKATIKAADDCKWDILSLGEVMLRLDPGDTRVARTRQFKIGNGNRR